MALEEQLTEDQQVVILRRWLRENVPFMLGGMILCFGGLLGWNQWQDYSGAQAEKASALYENIALAIRAERSIRANELIIELEKAHGNSPYLDQSRLILAKFFLDQSEFETAADYLEKVMSDGESTQMRHIARIRSARVRLQQQQLDEALALIETIDADSAFAARYHDLRGDIYFAMNKLGDARVEYEAALGFDQQPPLVDRVYVQAKLDDLGGASDPGISESPMESVAEPEPEPAAEATEAGDGNIGDTAAQE